MDPIGPDPARRDRVGCNQQPQMTLPAHLRQFPGKLSMTWLSEMAVDDAPSGRQGLSRGHRVGRTRRVCQVQDRRQARRQVAGGGACGGAELAFGGDSVFLRHAHD